jgi:putative NIF3 family GTP cyclohydrolase 1 type 2
MKKSEVIDRILNYHPSIENYTGCDDYKSDGKEDECTGIASALVPTMEVIQKTVALGCNLLVVHEPIYYQTPDYSAWKGNFENKVQKEKEFYIKEHGITIWRDHDHMHTHQPDCIFTGVMKYLGWEKYYNKEISAIMPLFYVFDIPECTVAALGAYLKEKIGMNGMRIVGCPEDKMRRVAIAAHLYPNSFMVDEVKEDGFYHSYDMEIMRCMEEADVDAIIPGEIIEWTILSYIRDAAFMGKGKACFNIGHFNMEELGMRYAADWIGELVNHEIPVHYVPTGDGWCFL